MRQLRWLIAAAACGLLLVAASAPPALAAVQHGISFSKGCASPTPIGSPVLCSYTVGNNADDAGDTQTIVSLVDTVHSAGGDVVSGNLLRTSASGMTTTTLPTSGSQSGSACYQFVRSGSDLSATNGSTTVTSASASFTGADLGRELLIDGTPYTIVAVPNGAQATLALPYGATNNSPSATGLSWTVGVSNPAQDGTGAHPYTEVAFCELPFGSQVNVLSTSHYTAQPSDFVLPSHLLNDDASLAWKDECNGLAAGPPPGGGNCNPDPSPAGAGSSTIVAQLSTSTSSAIHNAAHLVVTTVPAGSSVHDFVTVVPVVAGGPTPTGNVTIDWLSNVTDNAACAGTLLATSGPFPLNASGQLDAGSFNQTPNTAGHFAFRAHYAGDGTFTASDAPCEPLAVVDANIQITPNGVNRVGQAHTFTAHVNVNSGSGFANAPDGTQISFTIDSGPGSFTTPNPCTTTGGTGSCTITLTSVVTGQTVVSAHTDVTVSGVSLHRDTNGVSGNSGPATKTWVNAAISIAPSATNEVNHSHTFTVTLVKDIGNGAGFVPAAGEHVDVTLTDSNGAAHTAPTGSCTTAGPNTDANGQCTITFSSPTAGKVTGTATSTLSVGGVPITVSTDGLAPNSGPAVKTFVDARISISPNGTNRVGQTHTFTGHVTVNDGSGAGFVDAPPGTQISFTIDNGSGSFTSPNPCTVAAGGSCQVQLTSAATGMTTVSAHSTGSAGGVVLIRNTNGTAGNSGPATKTWVNARIHITPNATNAIGQPHTFTVLLEKDTGNGAGFVPAAGEHVDVTLTNGAGATHTAPTGTCTTAGANTDAAGQCTITFTSPTAGTVTGHATSTLSVAGSAPFTVQTDGVAPNGPDAVKTFVGDANIQISPANANNPVGANHVLTITVNAPGGTIDAGPHTATASIVAGPGSFVGSPSCTYVGGGATASCQVTITSSSVGTTVIQATSDIPVLGVVITRTTGTAANTASGGSGNASKNWAASQVATRVLDASNNDVTGATIPSGTVVHDEATVTKTAATPAAVPAPTGTVTFTLFNGSGCSGAPASTDPNEPLNAAGVATSTTFTTPAVGGQFSYRAHYNGDANYPQSDGPCEPFTVKPSAAQQLQTLLNAVTGVAPGSSLAAKVKTIQAYVAANDKAHACAALGAFINQVNAQQGKQLTAAQAASFTAQAVAIKATLGC